MLYHIESLDIYYCDTEANGKYWGVGFAHPASQSKSAMNQKLVTVWGIPGQEVLQAKFAEGKTRFDLVSKKEGKGYKFSKACSATLEITSGTDRGQARLTTKDALQEATPKTEVVKKHSFAVVCSAPNKDSLIRSEVKTIFVNAATQANECVEAITLDSCVVKVGDDSFTFSNDAIRVPNSVNFDANDGFVGSGQFTRYEVAFIFESALRAVNDRFGRGTYVLDLTVDGESSVRLENWEDMVRFAKACNPDTSESEILALAEKMDLITPRFDIASAVSNSGIESFF